MKLILKKKLLYENGQIKKSLLEPTELLETINALPGIYDVSSTPLYEPNGGWSESFIIFFEVNSNDNTGLFFLTRCLDRRYFIHGNDWTLILEVGYKMRDDNLPIIYMIERKNFKNVNIESEIKELINNMNRHLNNKAFMDLYGLDINTFSVFDKKTGKPWSLSAIEEDRNNKLNNIIYR